MNISVHIERLILDGLPVAPDQRPLLQAAVEAELARLFAVGGLTGGMATGGAVPYVPAGAIPIAGGADPAALGTQIAQAVYGGINR